MCDKLKSEGLHDSSYQAEDAERREAGAKTGAELEGGLQSVSLVARTLAVLATNDCIEEGGGKAEIAGKVF